MEEYKKTIMDESDKFIGADDRGKEKLKRVMGVYRDVTKDYSEKDLKSDSMKQAEVVDKLYSELVATYGSEFELRNETGIDLATLIETRKGFEMQKGVYGMDDRAFEAMAYNIINSKTRKEQDNVLANFARIDKSGWKEEAIGKLELLTGRKVENAEMMDPLRLNNEYSTALEKVVNENENPLYKPFDLSARLQMADDYLQNKAA